MSEQIFLTPQGLQELKKEYQGLVEVKRPELLARVEEMRSLGDLSENEAYKEARRQQSFLEGRIAEIEEVLKKAAVIQQEDNGRIQVGSKIKVHLEQEEQEFQIVDEHEADLSVGKISHQSPIGQALLGKKAGDEVKIAVPAGMIRYKILAVETAS